MVAEVRSHHDSEWAAISAVAQRLGIGSSETVRTWVRQAEVDAGIRSGVTTDESAELKRLRRENAELRRANEILKSASAFFAAELDRLRSAREVRSRPRNLNGRVDPPRVRLVRRGE
jgi:transposase